MAQININTSQNVEINYSTASILARIVSQLMDYIVIAAYGMIVFFIVKYISVSDYVVYPLFIPVLFYSFIMESLFQGQSVGKMILKLKVVKLDGTQAGLLSYFIRWIFRIIDITGYGAVAIISIAVSKKGQRLGDIAAGTTVVNLRKKQDFSYSVFQVLDEDYTLQIAEVEKLSEKDIKTIVMVIKNYKSNYSISSRNLLMKTKDAVQTKMGITSNLPAYKFLTTVVKDYNYLVINDEY